MQGGGFPRGGGGFFIRRGDEAVARLGIAQRRVDDAAIGLESGALARSSAIDFGLDPTEIDQRTSDSRAQRADEGVVVEQVALGSSPRSPYAPLRTATRRVRFPTEGLWEEAAR